MPCYSNIQTVLISLTDIRSAAEVLGMEVIKRTSNRYTLKASNGEYIDIERKSEGEKFETVAYSGSAYWPKYVLEPMVVEYAKVRTKSLMRKLGYTATQGAAPDELNFTSYR